MERLHRLMRRQHGLCTRDQALLAGLTRHRVEHLVATGAWLVVRRGVYAAAGAPPTYEQAVLAAVLAAGQRSVAAGPVAAWLWRLTPARPDGLEVACPAWRRMRLDGVTARRCVTLFDDDVTTVQAIPVTSAERTIVDVSTRVGRREIGRMVDAGLRRGAVRLDHLVRCVGRLTPAPGRSLSRVQAELALRMPGYDPGESDLETRVLRLVAGAGLPLPRQQHRVGRYRVDLAWPELRLAVELDGFAYHRGRAAFDADRLRGNELVLRGWRLLRFTAAHGDEEILGQLTGATGRLAG